MPTQARAGRGGQAAGGENAGQSTVQMPLPGATVVVHQGTVKGNNVRWLRAGTRDGLPHGIALDAVDKGKETAYLFRVGPKFNLVLVRKTHGQNISPRVFSH
jgi:hypothetical protein